MEKCHWEGSDKLQRRLFLPNSSLPENILYAERLQHKCLYYSGHAHIALGNFVHRIHTCRAGKDLILAGMNLVYATLDWQFSRCFLNTFPVLKIMLSSWIIYHGAPLSFRDKYFQMFKHNSWDRNNVWSVASSNVWYFIQQGWRSPQNSKQIVKILKCPLPKPLGTKNFGCQMHVKPLPGFFH